VKVRKLEEVAAYIEEHSNAHPSQSPQEQYGHIEMLAIAVLDSEFDLYPEDTLQDFLMDYLDTKRRQLGL